MPSEWPKSLQGNATGRRGRGSPSHHLTVVILSDGPLSVPILFGPPVAPRLPLQPPLLPPLLPVPLVLQLLGVVVALLEEIFCVLIKLHVQEVELLNALASTVIDLHIGSPRDVELCEGRDELEVECPLKEKLCLPLEFREPKEGHVLQVVFRALQQDGIPFALIHESQVVAAHQAEVRQHAHLAVVGQVVGAVHELSQANPRPVIPRVAGR